MQNRCCKDCQDRAVGCHSTCPKYIAYKKEIEAIRKKRLLEGQAEAAEYEIRAQFAERRRRHKRPEA